MKKLYLSVAAFAALLVAGCNTVEGIGQDVSSVGETVSDAADL